MEDNNILVLNFADAKIPEFKELRNKDWVYYGEDDDFPEYIATLYGKSAKHGAIINNKVVYIYGSGLKPKTPSPVADAWLQKANPYQSWNQLAKQSIMDIEVFGGFYWLMIPKMGGGYNKYLMPFKQMRVSKDGGCYFYKKDWKDRTEDMKKYPSFYPGIKEAAIYYFREYRAGADNRYSLPGYINALNYIESDVEVSKHTLTNAKTGFSASKFINFYDGQPEEGKKRAIQRRFENAFSGSEGKKLIIAFNNDPNKKPTVDDLGASDLTKEDFTAIDNLISSNIYAGHQITSPILFGIKESGQLGGTTELKNAYEIFKNTYANNKQKQFEEIINYFAAQENAGVEFELQATEPIGMEISAEMILAAAPKSWLLDKMGIDPTEYTDAPVGGTATAPDPNKMGVEVNDHLKNLTGRQFQAIDRIKRKYKAGQLSREEAALMLKSGYGLTDEDVTVMLGNAAQFSEDSNEFDDEVLSMEFDATGETREDYEIVSSKPFKFDSDEEMTETLELFKEGEKGLLKRITGIVPKIMIRYSYEKRKDAPGPSVLETTRPFCKKLIALDRFYSREDIQRISEAVGYNVFKRTGGFWNKNGKIVPHCRHEWRTNIVIKKTTK